MLWGMRIFLSNLKFKGLTSGSTRQKPPIYCTSNTGNPGDIELNYTLIKFSFLIR